MSLKRLARELDENTRQTSEMVDGIIEALGILQNTDTPCEEARQKAMTQIVFSLQAQDRLEQRSNNLAIAVRKLVEHDKDIDHSRFDAIWSHLTLDELAVPNMSGVAARVEHGEVDLF